MDYREVAEALRKLDSYNKKHVRFAAQQDRDTLAETREFLRPLPLPS